MPCLLTNYYLHNSAEDAMTGDRRDDVENAETPQSK